MNISKFTLIRIGFVAKDKEEDIDYIDVYPIESQPNKDNEISEIDTLNETIIDHDGNIENIVVEKGTLFKALWIPDGDINRYGAPDVRKGELVKIYKYGDVDRYYWTPLYNEIHLRTREKRTIMLSNRETMSEGPEDDEKVYFMTMDTINKIIHIHTDDTDGEPCTYDISINTADGILEIADGLDNTITLNSVEGSLITNTNDSITTNTVSTTENSKGPHAIVSKTFTATASGDELVGLLSELVGSMMTQETLGNLGIPAPLMDSTISTYADYKARLDKIRG